MRFSRHITGSSKSSVAAQISCHLVVAMCRAHMIECMTQQDYTYSTGDCKCFRKDRSADAWPLFLDFHTYKIT